MCIDEKAESGGGSRSTQARVYPVEIECGSIKCGSGVQNYLANHELTCAVCTSPSKRKTSVFTRWGHTQCPGDTKVLYSGFAAGSHHGYAGSGASVMCMTLDVKYVDYNGNSQDGGRLYGYEYETSGYGLWSDPYRGVHDKEVTTSRPAA